MGVSSESRRAYRLLFGGSRLSGAPAILADVARGVILGEQQQPAGLTILVPRGYEDTRIVGVCHVCGGEFGEGQEADWHRHVPACARAHLDEIRASTPRQRAKGTPFDPENWDPEVEEHLLAVGRRMLAEGRMEVLPSERAGLS